MLTFSPKNYNPVLARKFQEYFATIFNLPATEEKNIVVLFLGPY
jgi:hypothetical protein